MPRKNLPATLKGEVVPSRPGRDGYVLDFAPEYARRYVDFFGDLNPFHEAAAARVILSRVLELLEKQFQDLAADDGEVDLTDTRLRRLQSAINSVNRTSEIIARAHDQIVGKKVVVAFPSERISEEVRKQCDVFVSELLDWLPGCLCLDCRTRLSEELQSRQRISLHEESE